MKLGITKKLILSYGLGIVLLLIFIAVSYANLKSFLFIEERNSEISNRMEMIGDLQVFINKLLMPPNDYLITGDEKERETFARLVTESAGLFEKIRSGSGMDKETKTLAGAVEKGFIELQQKGMVILSMGNPTRNREAAVLMKALDAQGQEVVLKIEKMHDAIKTEMKAQNKRAREINGESNRNFALLLIIFLLGIVFMAFFINLHLPCPDCLCRGKAGSAGPAGH